MPGSSIVITAVISVVLACASGSTGDAEVASDSLQNRHYEDAPPTHPQVKRGAKWQSLGGSWGKRGDEDVLDYLPDNSLDQDADKRDWNKFRGSWGKKSNNWRQLQGSWGKRGLWQDYLQSHDDPALLQLLARMQLQDPIPEGQEIPQSGLDGDKPVSKRSWTKYAAQWGKRPYSPRGVSQRATNWSSLRGSWGKRSNGWSDPQDNWDSKRTADWNKFRGSWGKREAGSPDEDFVEESVSE